MGKSIKFVVGFMSVALVPIAMLYTAWKWALEWVDGVTL